MAHTCKFSIVIPTRDRCETLPFAMRTVLAQSFDDFEVVVCDNCSSDATPSSVAEFQDSRVKYFRSETSLAMSDSWELAVSLAQGEFIIIIGDDDGLMPGALSRLAAILQQSPCSVVRWERVGYRWPNVEPQLLPNCISIPLGLQQQTKSSSAVIRKVLRQPSRYLSLPMLYNSAVSHDLIRELKKRTGRVFSHSSPDVYSGFAVAKLAKTFVSLQRPMSINGGSAKSNGLTSIYGTKRDSVSRDFHKLHATSNLQSPSFFPPVRSLSAGVLDAFYVAKHFLFPKDRLLSVSQKSIIRHALRDLRASDETEWEQQIDQIADSLHDDPGLSRWFARKRRNVKPSLIERQSFVPVWGVNKHALTLDGAKFGLRDVFEVSQFAGALLGDEASIYCEFQAAPAFAQASPAA